MSPTPDPQFDAVINGAWTDDAPYNEPTAVKPGLTPRGKAALAIGGAVLAGGALVAYQNWAADQAAAELATRELALEEKRLELEERRLETATFEETKKTQVKTETARQKAVKACIEERESKVGKGFGAPTYDDLTDLCTSIHAPAVPTDDMQPAGATDTASDDSNEIGTGPLVGIAAAAVVGYALTRKVRRTTAD